MARAGASVENTWGERRKRAVFFSLCRRKRVGEKTNLSLSPLPSCNKNGPLFFTHLDGRGAVLCLSRGSGERRLRPLGSEEAEETTVPTSCALSFFTVSLSLLSPLLYSFFPEFSLCSTIWFFLVFVGGVDITPVFFFFLLVFFPLFGRRLSLKMIESNSKANALAAEAVERAALPLERVHDVEGRDGLAAGVLGVGDRVADHVLEEHLEDTAGLLVDEARDALDTAAASQAPDGGLRDTLDVVAQDLAVPLGAALAEALAACFF